MLLRVGTAQEKKGKEREGGDENFYLYLPYVPL